MGITVSRDSSVRAIIFTLTLVIIGVLVLIPLVFLLYGSFFTPAYRGQAAQFTFQNYVRAYLDPHTYAYFFNSFVFALGHTVVAVILGTFMAWVVERTNTPGKRVFSLLALIPLMIPSILENIAWVFLASPKMGLLNVMASSLFGFKEGLFNIYSMGGMIWVSGLHWSPFVFLTMAAAFRSMDPSLEEAALMSGVSMRQTLWRVTLRLNVPALLGSCLIMFVRGLELFETPAILGLPAGIQVFTTKIFLAIRRYPPELGLAASYAVIIMAITCLLVYYNHRMLSHSHRYSTISGKAFRARVMPLGRGKYFVFGLVVLYFILVVGLPLSILCWSSLLNYYEPPSMQALSRLTLQNYVFLFEREAVGRAFLNSTLLALGTAIGVMLLTSVAAWITIKSRMRGRWILDSLVSLPMTFPGLVMGVGLIWAYTVLPLPIYGTIWILLIAYITRYLPYGMRNSASAMIQISTELEEAAQMTGASWQTIFRRIYLPLLKSGFLAGGSYIVLVSIKELSSSILLYSYGSEVLSVVIWDWWQSGYLTQVSAMAVVMIVLIMTLSYLFHRLSAKYGIKEEKVEVSA